MLRQFALAVLLVMVYGSPARAEESKLHKLFGCNVSDRVCVIGKTNAGGFISYFDDAADEVNASGVSVVIDALCESSCVRFAYRIRSRVCLTERARMLIHRFTDVYLYDRWGHVFWPRGDIESSPVPHGYRKAYVPIDTSYGQGIDEWADAEGKIAPDPDVMYLMTRGEESQFWPMCPPPRILAMAYR